ncbi:M20 family metallopeptidase [Candidatus Bathyarchaeota archaeon]|nr:M20 family metallopeptidase [Candidatus Bathyarchaeota archaeon]
MVSREDVLKQVEDLREEIVNFTKELVKIPTVNPPGNKYDECAALIAKKLQTIGFNVQLIEVPSDKLKELAPHSEGLPRVSVLGSLKGAAWKPSLHFNGHFDVVPPGTGWTRDPFLPTFDEGKLYGRGTSDMKGGIAAMVMAAQALVEAGVKLRGELSISAVPDEETGGFAGTGYLVKNQLIKADYAIVTEPSSISTIWNAHKGALWLEITTLGKAAHGSLPFMGINAFEKLIKVAQALEGLKPKLTMRTSSHHVEPKEAMHPTIMIGGVVLGGVKVNVVPSRCSMTIDRRLIPEEKMSDAKKEIEDVLKSLNLEDPELKIEVKSLLEADAAVTPQGEKICETLAKNIKQVTDITPRFNLCTAFLDMRFLVNQAGIPTISYGPGLLKTAHTADEYVLVDDLVNATKVLALTAMDLLK